MPKLSENLRREWYVYVLPSEDIPLGTVLSGYMAEAEAREEAERVEFEIPKWRGLMLVLPRSDARILEYARTRPAWARREGFASISSNSSSEQEIREGDVGTLVESIMAEDTAGRSRRIPAGMEVKVSAVYPTWISFITGEVIEGENVFTAPPLTFKRAFRKRGASPTSRGEQAPPPHDCPVCGDAVAGGPEDYLGHIKAKHPEEWRKLETDPSYTLRRAEAGPRQLVPIVRRLPTVTIREKKYYLDARLREYRAVDDPHDRIPLEPEYAKLLGEASEGSVAWNAVVESIIEEKQREAERRAVEKTREALPW